LKQIIQSFVALHARLNITTAYDLNEGGDAISANLVALKLVIGETTVPVAIRLGREISAM
jgi:hypothetical protein